jgi:hypothetical protein
MSALDFKKSVLPITIFDELTSQMSDLDKDEQEKALANLWDILTMKLKKLLTYTNKLLETNNLSEMLDFDYDTLDDIMEVQHDISKELYEGAIEGKQLFYAAALNKYIETVVTIQFHCSLIEARIIESKKLAS